MTLSRLTRTAAVAAVLTALALLASVAMSGPAGAHVVAPESDPIKEQQLVKKVKAAKDEAAASGKTIVRGDWGFWDSSTQEAYIDAGARVAHLEQNKLVDLERGPAVADGEAAGDVVAQWHPASCHNTDNLTHCEQAQNRPGCNPTWAYLNYDDRTDDFSGVYPADYSRPIWPGEWINVRNAPYRMIGARGVRIFRDGRWLFMSNNCL